MLTRIRCRAFASGARNARTPVGDRNCRRRVLDCAVMTAACVGVFGSWVIVSELTSGEFHGASLRVPRQSRHGFLDDDARSASVMLLPAPVPSAARFLFLAVRERSRGLGYGEIRAGVAACSVKSAIGDPALIPIVLIFLSLFYAAFLVLSVMIQYRLNLTGRFPAASVRICMPLQRQLYSGAKALSSLQSRTLRSLLPRSAGIILTSNLARPRYSRSPLMTGPWICERTWRVPGTPGCGEATGRRVDLLQCARPDRVSIAAERSVFPARFNHLTGRDDGPKTFHEEINELRNKLEQRRTRMW